MKEKNYLTLSTESAKNIRLDIRHEGSSERVLHINANSRKVDDWLPPTPELASSYDFRF